MAGKIIVVIVSVLLFFGCIETDIKNDLVDPELQITNPIMSLKVGESYDLRHRYLNHVGDPDSTAEIRWTSAHPEVLAVDKNGILNALTKGKSVVTASPLENDTLMAQITVEVADTTIVVSRDLKTGKIATTSSYELTGDFEMRNVEGGVDIAIAGNYKASSALPGLYVYLSNNPSTTSGALEIGKVTIFSGNHSYSVSGSDLTIDTYKYLLYFCKPFNVKVGHGEISD